jgi:hypothetical protein
MSDVGEIAVCNRSRNLSDHDLAFMVEACAAQVEEAAAAWGIPPVPVQLYRNGEGVLPPVCWVFTVVDSIDMTGALGYHDDWAGTIYGQILAQGDATSVTLSHECLETLVDRTCTGWRPLPDGRDVALEVCDPCESDSYLQSVTIFGETRGVMLSNYVLPSWFDPAGQFPYDRLRRLGSGAPTQTPGGYILVRDQDGNVSNVFASGHMPARMIQKLSNPRSRTLRRLGGRA